MNSSETAFLPSAEKISTYTGLIPQFSLFLYGSRLPGSGLLSFTLYWRNSFHYYFICSKNPYSVISTTTTANPFFLSFHFFDACQLLINTVTVISQCFLRPMPQQSYAFPCPLPLVALAKCLGLHWGLSVSAFFPAQVVFFPTLIYEDLILLRSICQSQNAHLQFNCSNVLQT